VRVLREETEIRQRVDLRHMTTRNDSECPGRAASTAMARRDPRSPRRTTGCPIRTARSAPGHVVLPADRATQAAERCVGHLERPAVTLRARSGARRRSVPACDACPACGHPARTRSACCTGWLSRPLYCAGFGGTRLGDQGARLVDGRVAIEKDRRRLDNPTATVNGSMRCVRPSSAVRTRRPVS
jgi:hypothetical protein